MSVADLMVKSLLEGGPYAISLAGWLAWWWERKTNKEINTRVIDLATAQVEATLRLETAMATNNRINERLLNDQTRP